MFEGNIDDASLRVGRSALEELFGGKVSDASLRVGEIGISELERELTNEASARLGEMVPIKDRPGPLWIRLYVWRSCR